MIFSRILDIAGLYIVILLFAAMIACASTAGAAELDPTPLNVTNMTISDDRENTADPYTNGWSIQISSPGTLTNAGR